MKWLLFGLLVAATLAPIVIGWQQDRIDQRAREDLKRGVDGE